MKIVNKKTYIQPEALLQEYTQQIMQVNTSPVQGGEGDPTIDDEDDELSKGRKSGWGNLW